jgi:hypothetical protein
MFFGKKKVKDTALEVGPETDKKKDTLYLYVSENGWAARIASVNKQTSKDIETGGVPEMETPSDERIRGIFKLAATHFSKRVLRDVGQIYILIDEANIAVIDNKENHLRAPNPAMLRELGARQLNTDQTSYGERTLGNGPAQSMPDGYLGEEAEVSKVNIFIDQKTLQSYLSEFETGVLALKSVVPVQDLLLRITEKQKITPSAALYISEQNIYIAMVHVKFGQASVRTIPIGKMSIINAIAENQSVSLTEASVSLAGRDHLSSINLSQVKSGASSMTANAFDVALGPVLVEIIQAITDTIDYFSNQRASGTLGKLTIYGDLNGLQGFRKILESNLHYQLEFPEKSLLDEFCTNADAGTVNLLSGAEGSLISVGKMSYSFHENRFVESTALAEEKFNVEQKFGSNSTTGRISRRPEKNKKKPPTGRLNDNKAGPKNNSSFFGMFKKKPDHGPSRQHPGQQAGEDDDAQNSADRAGFMLVSMLAFGVLYMGWMEFESADLSHRSSTSAIYSNLQEQTDFRRSLSKKLTDAPILSIASDKVLWSEKLLSIAANMNEAMWITDVYLVDETRNSGGENIIRKKLVMEGAVLPSTDGHILEISRYISKLLKDQDFFMSDFRKINFEGAEVDVTEDDHVVRFMIEAEYDENIRREKKKELSAENPPVIQQMQQNITDRDAVQKNVSGEN